jgi:hypothetical protein
MFIKDKTHSFEMMEALGVNRVISRICNNTSELLDFVNDLAFNHKPFFGIRQLDKRGGGGICKVNMKVKDYETKNESDSIILAEQFEEEYSKYFPLLLTESITHLTSEIIYQGEIQLLPCGRLWGRISYEKTWMRPAMNSPSVQHLSHERLTWDYFPIRVIIDYCVKYGLIGPVIEFQYFDRKVGINNEKIVLWELRNY